MVQASLLRRRQAAGFYAASGIKRGGPMSRPHERRMIK